MNYHFKNFQFNKTNKYNNIKTEIDGHKFDSLKEARRYQDLKFLLQAGEIRDLKLQPRFELMAGFKWKGKTYRKIEYIADFSYFDNETNILIIEDVKGVKTEAFKLKEKLFLKKMIKSGEAFDFRII